MSNLNTFEIHNHPKQFLAAIEHTAFETGFQPALIEKDYYCSIILNYFSRQPENLLTFKGGTLLAKGHAGFYRLSEDLDFNLPISSNATRKQRSNLIKPFKQLIIEIPNVLPEFIIGKAPEGSNQSRQYNSELLYQSVLDDSYGRILLEIGLREKLIMPAVLTKLRTALLNPFSNKIVISPFEIRSLSLIEAYAEKIRAAFTRDRLAIRDFFDIDYALKNKIIRFNDDTLLTLASQKIRVNNEAPIILDDATYRILVRKIDTELAPTLKNQDTDSFDLDSVISKLRVLSNNFEIKNQEYVDSPL